MVLWQPAPALESSTSTDRRWLSRPYPKLRNQQVELAHANEAIQLWIDTAKEFGDPVPEPKGERLMLA